MMEGYRSYFLEMCNKVIADLLIIFMGAIYCTVYIARVPADFEESYYAAGYIIFMSKQLYGSDYEGTV